MRKVPFILGCLLLASTNTAFAEWKEYDRTESMSMHYDPAKVRSIGKKTYRVWALTSFEKPLGVGSSYFQSIEFVAEYNCLNETSRVVQDWVYEKGYAQGRLVRSTNYSTAKFEFLDPTADNQRLFNIVCKK